MYWETDESAPAPGPAEAVDVTFRLEGHSLPADYAPALAEALADPLADFSRLPGFGVKVLHLPVSGNGWHRSEGQPIYLSRRVQLLLRVPRDRARAALAFRAPPLRWTARPVGWLGDGCGNCSKWRRSTPAGWCRWFTRKRTRPSSWRRWRADWRRWGQTAQDAVRPSADPADPVGAGDIAQPDGRRDGAGRELSFAVPRSGGRRPLGLWPVHATQVGDGGGVAPWR